MRSGGLCFSKVLRRLTETPGTTAGSHSVGGTGAFIFFVYDFLCYFRRPSVKSCFSLTVFAKIWLKDDGLHSEEDDTTGTSGSERDPGVTTPTSHGFDLFDASLIVIVIYRISEKRQLQSPHSTKCCFTCTEVQLLWSTAASPRPHISLFLNI